MNSFITPAGNYVQFPEGHFSNRAIFSVGDTTKMFTMEEALAIFDAGFERGSFNERPTAWKKAPATKHEFFKRKYNKVL
jgi:hypothetical protein